MAPKSESSAPRLGALLREIREIRGWSGRELARRAGVSHTQVSRLETGEIAKPSRNVLVALARALDRNPLPMLIVAGHYQRADAAETLLALFRPDAELLEVWGEWAAWTYEQVGSKLRDDETPMSELQQIAADVFMAEENEESMWHDTYEIAASRGEDADQLRHFTVIWRYLGRDQRQRWLEYGEKLREIVDLEERAEATRAQLAANERNQQPKET